MRGEKLALYTTLTLVTETCCDCGVTFAMPSELKGKLLETGKLFYCPSGHSQYYGESTTEKQLHQVEQQLREEQEYAKKIREQRDGALKEISAKKAIITRMKNRSKNGVCLECHRHFGNLERHMETKHSRQAGE